MFCAHLIPGKLCRLGAAAICSIVVLAASQAQATNCSYSLMISEDLGRLDPSVPIITTTTSAEWVTLRNNPYLEITNTSDPASGASLTSLSIQLNNPTQDLVITKINLDNVGGVVFTSPTVVPTSASHAITLNFQNGTFNPGDSVIFRVHLVPVTSKDSKFADYRQVFTKFDDSTNTTGNATSSVTFTTTDPQNPTVTAGPNVWNNLPAYLKGTTSFSVAYSCLNSPDTVINIPGNSGNVPLVPEPSALILAGLGLVGVVIGRKRLQFKR
jgi:hypothetical protein